MNYSNDTVPVDYLDLFERQIGGRRSPQQELDNSFVTIGSPPPRIYVCMCKYSVDPGFHVCMYVECATTLVSAYLFEISNELPRKRRKNRNTETWQNLNPKLD